MKVQEFLDKEQEDRVVESIRSAERNTSGEIRVHIENRCRGEVIRKAARIFRWLKMHKTAARNGVLFYVAVEDQKFAIIADEGINQKVPENFWNQIKAEMEAYFRKGDYATGLEKGILMTGEQLQSHFPYQSDDVNELPDEISYG